MKNSTKIKYDFYENQTLLEQTRRKIHIIKEEIIPYYGSKMTLQELLDCLEEQEQKFSNNIETIFKFFDNEN